MNFALSGLSVFLLALISPILLLFSLIQFVWMRIAFWKFKVIENEKFENLEKHRDLAYTSIQCLEGVVHVLPNLADSDPYLKKYANHILMAYLIIGAVRDNHLNNDFKNSSMPVFGVSSSINDKSDFLQKIKAIDVTVFNDSRDEFLESLDASEALYLVERLVSFSLDQAYTERLFNGQSASVPHPV